MKKLRVRVWEWLSPGSHGFSRVVDLVIVTLVLLDVACFILDSLPSLKLRFGTSLQWFEHLVLTVFTFDYLLRLWACREDPRYDSPIRGRFAYAVTAFALIDLVAILPALTFLPFMEGLLSFDAQLTVFRVVRVFRIGKLARYSRSVHTMWQALMRVRQEFSVVLVSVLILILISSTLVYVVEEGENEQFSSIPQAMWWAVVTMTTVGYGDLAPTTALGRLIGSALMVCGIGMFALPAGLLGAAFTEEMREEDERRLRKRQRRLRRAEVLREEREEREERAHGQVVCPHCARHFVPEEREHQTRGRDGPAR